jgi:DHA1 family bicyclomycin/chloramphenicol resistance-like MFS transporter
MSLHKTIGYGDDMQPRLWVLVCLGAIGPLAMNIFIPSIPGLMSIFESSYATVQLVLTAYLVSMAFAQLIVGPLSDRFGRRLVALTGLSVCVFGSVLCIYSVYIEMLIVGRVIQAIGACSGLVMARTIIRDIFGLDKAASMMGYLTMAMVIVPMLAPTIGGVLDDFFGWQASFFLVMTYGIVIFILCSQLLKETHFGPFNVRNPQQVLLDFWRLLKQWRFSRHAFQISFSSAAFFSFLGGSPFVVIELMGATKSEYGFYYIFAAGSYMFGNFLTGRYSQKLGSRRIILLGTSIGFFGGIFLYGVYLLNLLSPLLLFMGMGIIALGNGLCLPSGTAAAISADPDRIGTAAGLAGFMQIGFGSGGAFLAGSLISNSAAPLLVIMLLSVSFGFLINLVGQKLD